MSAFFECDNCKKQEPGLDTVPGFDKPKLWYMRVNAGKTQVVCSADCGLELNEKTNTQSLIKDDIK